MGNSALKYHIPTSLFDWKNVGPKMAMSTPNPVAFPVWVSGVQGMDHPKAETYFGVKHPAVQKGLPKEKKKKKFPSLL